VGALTAGALNAGVALCLIVAAAALPQESRGPRTVLMIAAAGAALGVVVGGALGWAWVEIALSDVRAFVVVKRIVIRAIGTGSLLAALVMSVESIDWPPRVLDTTLETIGHQILAPIGNIAFLTIWAWVIGLVLFSAPAILLVGPTVAMWRILVRRLFPR
jgi:hypothetical protein